MSLRSLLRRGHHDLGVVYSPEYLLDVPGTAHDALRGERILTFLGTEKLVRPQDVQAPKPAPIAALRRVHDDGYLESLHAPGGLLPIVGFEVIEPLQSRILAMLRWMTGGTIAALSLAVERRRIVVNLGGGFHHAHRARGAGFCAYNDIAIAIAAARAAGFAGRVLVVDLDLHDGDGTRSLFAADPTVHTFSMHSQGWDDAGALESTSVELGTGVTDAASLAALDRELPPLFQRFQPALVIFLAGVDAAADDRLGDGQLTASGVLARDRRVFELARDPRGDPLPTVMLLAGGYGSEAWRYSARTLAWLAAGRPPEPIEPPSTSAIALERYRDMARLRNSETPGPAPRRRAARTAAPAFDDWGLGDDDLAAGLVGPPRETRLLGHYTEAALELALERAGLIDRLRHMGFSDPQLELDVANPNGQTVRLYADADRQDLLVEARLRRDRATLEGMELLAVEWLLLQNPRAAVTAARPLLPGQKHPGLGLAEDVSALLVLACERLQLDGILFVPSHFHHLLSGPKGLRFLDPIAEAGFRRLKELVADLPLAEAAARLERGELRDPETGETLAWKPSAVVYPVSAALRERVYGDEYSRRLAAATARSL